MEITENEILIETDVVDEIPANEGMAVTLDSVYAEYENSRSIPMKFTLVLKRVIDLLGSTIGLVLLAPLFLVVSIAIKIDSPGPVFYKQERLGLYGQAYNMYKFRTMCQNAENMEAGIYSFAGDVRVTKVGNWLRKTSIDELAQLINVLTGNMSLVGPRPPVTYELGDFATLNKRYKRRFRVKPGMTGLAQVIGRNKNTWDYKVNFDNKYIEKLEKHGIWIDIVILYKTLGYVLKHNDIVEEKLDESLDDIAAAEAVQKEIIRLAHILEEEDLT